MLDIIYNRPIFNSKCDQGSMDWRVGWLRTVKIKVKGRWWAAWRPACGNPNFYHFYEKAHTNTRKRHKPFLGVSLNVRASRASQSVTSSASRTHRANLFTFTILHKSLLLQHAHYSQNTSCHIYTASHTASHRVTRPSVAHIALEYSCDFNPSPSNSNYCAFINRRRSIAIPLLGFPFTFPFTSCFITQSTLVGLVSHITIKSM